MSFIIREIMALASFLAGDEPGFRGQRSGAAEQHRYGDKYKTVGECPDRDLVVHHPAAKLKAENVSGAVGEKMRAAVTASQIAA